MSSTNRSKKEHEWGLYGHEIALYPQNPPRHQELPLLTPPDAREKVESIQQQAITFYHHQFCQQRESNEKSVVAKHPQMATVTLTQTPKRDTPPVDLPEALLGFPGPPDPP